MPPCKSTYRLLVRLPAPSNRKSEKRSRNPSFDNLRSQKFDLQYRVELNPVELGHAHLSMHFIEETDSRNANRGGFDLGLESRHCYLIAVLRSAERKHICRRRHSLHLLCFR